MVSVARSLRYSLQRFNACSQNRISLPLPPFLSVTLFVCVRGCPCILLSVDLSFGTFLGTEKKSTAERTWAAGAAAFRCSFADPMRLGAAACPSAYYCGYVSPAVICVICGPAKSSSSGRNIV